MQLIFANPLHYGKYSCNYTTNCPSTEIGWKSRNTREIPVPLPAGQIATTPLFRGTPSAIDRTQGFSSWSRIKKRPAHAGSFCFLAGGGLGLLAPPMALAASRPTSLRSVVPDRSRRSWSNPRVLILVQNKQNKMARTRRAILLFGWGTRIRT